MTDRLPAIDQQGPTPQETPISGACGPQAGRLIINADDWGRDRATTEPILDCTRRGTISSVSAMVFMEDSERAAEIARERGIDAGLHLNLSAALTAARCPAKIVERQHRIASFLLWHPMARIVFHPGLSNAFEYVVAAQMDEFRRLYGREPQRIDGHHHLHLCANVLFGKLIPAGTIARRNFTFPSSEKSFINRMYRERMDRVLGRQHRLVDFLFNLAPLEPASRLHRIITLARQHVVELEAHPINPDEFGFLMGGRIFELVRDCPIAPNFAIPWSQEAQPLSSLAKRQA